MGGSSAWALSYWPWAESSRPWKRGVGKIAFWGKWAKLYGNVTVSQKIHANEIEFGHGRVRPVPSRVGLRRAVHFGIQNSGFGESLGRLLGDLERILSDKSRLPVLRGMEREPRRRFRCLTPFERHGNRKIRRFDGLNDQLRMDRHRARRKRLDGNRKLYRLEQGRGNFRGFQNYEDRRNPVCGFRRFAFGMIEILHRRRRLSAGRAHRPLERGMRLCQRGREERRNLVRERSDPFQLQAPR